MSEFSITVTDEGRETIARMTEHVDKLGNAYGEDHEWFRKAERSLRRSVAHLFGFGEVRVWRDDPLSLAGCTGYGLNFGLVFHRTHRSCTDEGCSAYARDDGSTYTFSGRREDILDHEHTWSYPLEAPTPGEWSFHS